MIVCATNLQCPVSLGFVVGTESNFIAIFMAPLIITCDSILTDGRPFLCQMVVLAQQAGGTMLVQVRIAGGSLISTSGTPRVTVVAAGVQAVMD